MDVSANTDVGDDAYVIGVDFGTLSARALVVRARDGAEAGTAVSEYPHGAIDRSLDGQGGPLARGPGTASGRRTGPGRTRPTGPVRWARRFRPRCGTRASTRPG